MGNDRNKDQATELEQPEIAELEDKDLEEASGGSVDPDSTGNNINCGC